MRAMSGISLGGRTNGDQRDRLFRASGHAENAGMAGLGRDDESLFATVGPGLEATLEGECGALLLRDCTHLENVVGADLDAVVFSLTSIAIDRWGHFSGRSRTFFLAPAHADSGLVAGGHAVLLGFYLCFRQSALRGKMASKAPPLSAATSPSMSRISSWNSVAHLPMWLTIWESDPPILFQP